MLDPVPAQGVPAMRAQCQVAARSSLLPLLRCRDLAGQKGQPCGQFIVKGTLQTQ